MQMGEAARERIVTPFAGKPVAAFQNELIRHTDGERSGA